MRRSTAAAVALLFLSALLHLQCSAALTMLPNPVACSVERAASGEDRCSYLYDAPVDVALDVDSAFTAGRANSGVSNYYGGMIRFLLPTNQTFNTVCFQQPPSRQVWDRDFVTVIGSVEVWPGEANPADAAPPAGVFLPSPTSALRCYPLQQVLTAKVVAFRLTMDLETAGQTAAATMMLAFNGAWEPASPAVPVFPAWMPETLPVLASEVITIHRAIDCEPKAATWWGQQSCVGAIDQTPALSDVNTMFPEGTAQSFAGASLVTAVVRMTLPSSVLVNGVCFQQRSGTPAESDRTGRIEVWPGHVSRPAMATTPPKATIVVPVASGMGLFCYRFSPSPLGFSAFELTFRLTMDLGSTQIHGAGTLLPAEIHRDDATDTTTVAPDAVPSSSTTSTSLVFAPAPLSCRITRSWGLTRPCATMYDTMPAASEVGTSFPAGRRTVGWLPQYMGVVRFLYAAPVTFNHVCFQQPPSNGNGLQAVVGTIEVWDGPSIGAPASSIVRVADTAAIECYALQQEIVATTNVTFRLRMASQGTGMIGAATLVVARRQSGFGFSARAAIAPAPLPETMPAATSDVRAIYAAASCSPPQQNCAAATQPTPALSDANTFFANGLVSDWATAYTTQSPYYVTLAGASLISGACFQQRVLRGPDPYAFAGRIDVWRGRQLEMDQQAPDATIVIPMATGRELLCYPLLDPATQAPVNFTTVDVSFRVWRADWGWDVHGASTLLPALISASPGPVPVPVPAPAPVPDPTPARPMPPPVSPPAPSTDPGQGFANRDDDSESGTTAIIIVVACAAAVVVIVIVAAVAAAAYARGRSAASDDVRISAANTQPKCSEEPQDVIPVEGQPVLTMENGYGAQQPDHTPSADERVPYAPPSQMGYAKQAQAYPSVPSEL